MLITCQCDFPKVEPNTNRLNLACNQLEYYKLKASTLTLDVTNRKAQSHIIQKLCISKNSEIY